MSKILDYSFARPDPAKIRDAGYSGVMRYLSPNAGKNLTVPERDRLRAAGLAIGLVWEWYAQRPLEGREAGVQDARAAVNQANALGFPAYLPIYFAVDWDATPQQQGPINAYFEGIRSVFSGRKLGIYGGYWVVKRVFDAQLVTHGWQTYAWSGGNWDKRAQLRQVLNGQWSGSVDFNESTSDDWGGWSSDKQPQPHPEPKPAPTPQGSGTYKIKAGDTFWGIETSNHWTHGTLQNLNPSVDPTKLQIGQTIKTPSAKAPAPHTSPGTNDYKIHDGDTFWGLEAKNGWPHGTLQGLNPHVNARSLKVGQVIKVPAGSTPQKAVPKTRQHKIAEGETFWGLETAHGWPHGTLQGLNKAVKPTELKIGQMINVPN